MSRQRDYQLRHYEGGLCEKCGNFATNGILCFSHATRGRKIARDAYTPICCRSLWSAVGLWGSGAFAAVRKETKTWTEKKV